MRTPLLAHIAPGRAILTWSHQVSTDPYDDHDVCTSSASASRSPGSRAGSTDARALTPEPCGPPSVGPW